MFGLLAPLVVGLAPMGETFRHASMGNIKTPLEQMEGKTLPGATILKKPRVSTMPVENKRMGTNMRPVRTRLGGHERNTGMGLDGRSKPSERAPAPPMREKPSTPYPTAEQPSVIDKIPSFSIPGASASPRPVAPPGRAPAPSPGTTRKPVMNEPPQTGSTMPTPAPAQAPSQVPVNAPTKTPPPTSTQAPTQAGVQPPTQQQGNAGGYNQQTHSTPQYTAERPVSAMSAGIEISPPGRPQQVQQAPQMSIAPLRRGERLGTNTYRDSTNLRLFQVAHANYQAQLGKYNTVFG